jgi:hypothetical protein
MRATYTLLGIIGLGALLLIGGILLTQNPLTAAEEAQLIPTPIGGQAHPTPVVTTTPIPLRSADVPRAASMGAIQSVNVADVRAPSFYLMRNRFIVQRFGKADTTLLFRNSTTHHDIRFDQLQPTLVLTDTMTNQEIRLGSDTGYAFLNGLTDDYVIWGYQCSRCDADDAFATGVSAYHLESGTNRTIVPDVGNINPVVDGNWVVFWVDETLSAQHLATAETIELATSFALPLEAFTRRGLTPVPEHFYAIEGTTVAWIDDDIHVFDLAQRTVVRLDLPGQATDQMYQLDVSENVVIWNSTAGWWGYDLVTETLFPISIMPPGWEQLKVAGWTVVTIQEEHLYWQIGVNEAFYGFTAPIVRNEP